MHQLSHLPDQMTSYMCSHCCQCLQLGLWKSILTLLQCNHGNWSQCLLCWLNHLTHFCQWMNCKQLVLRAYRPTCFPGFCADGYQGLFSIHHARKDITSGFITTSKQKLMWPYPTHVHVANLTLTHDCEVASGRCCRSRDFYYLKVRCHVWLYTFALVQYTVFKRKLWPLRCHSTCVCAYKHVYACNSKQERELPTLTLFFHRLLERFFIAHHRSAGRLFLIEMNTPG